MPVLRWRLESCFKGETTAAFFDSLIHSVPDWPLRFNPSTPPELERIVRKAIEKDAGLRYQSAAEMRADLQRLRREAGSGSSLPFGSPGRSLPDSKERIRAMFAAADAAVKPQPKASIATRLSWPRRSRRAGCSRRIYEAGRVAADGGLVVADYERRHLEALAGH